LASRSKLLKKFMIRKAFTLALHLPRIIQSIAMKKAMRGSNTGARVVDGRSLAREVLRDLESRVRENDTTPRLQVLLLGGDESSRVYARSIQRECKSIGCGFDLVEFRKEEALRSIRRRIPEFNEDPAVHGILILGPPRRRTALIMKVWPWKDAEGIHPANLGRMFGFRTGPLPSTPMAVLHILDRCGVSLRGKNVAVVGASNIVGKPLAVMMARRYATPDLCHIFTRDLKEHTLRADVVVAAAGRPNLLRADMVREGAIVVDVGINPVEHGIVGDVAFDEVKAKASLITPVPGGVGPLTTAMLLRNLVAMAL
jgi:methylenetetrahydrofolate dehydrogenase (NADP+)/methenyltetrahydrofolate cyclohydrolase